ncbi:unnamed protein product [Rotaria socialis]|uniref:Uncharacterized protein n=1 Tax=Rotaria socialis TaxID=392032 RepID=A0A818TEU7_9BILA|nr:unnamed protein product [Rotaria socialis]
MAEIDSIYQHLRTNSVSSANITMHETLSVSTLPRSSPCCCALIYSRLFLDCQLYQFFFFSVVAFYAWMFTSKHLAKSVRKTWKNQPASSLGKAVLKD